MTDDSLTELRALMCGRCFGTGMMEIVMADLRRGPWPCIYCEEERRIREKLDGGNRVDTDGAG